MIISLLPLGMGAQCNASSSESPFSRDYQFSNPNKAFALISDFIVTMDYFYAGFYNGEALRINRTSLIVDWAADYGDGMWAIALSSDSSYLICSQFLFGKAYLIKASASTGAIIDSYYTN